MFTKLYVNISITLKKLMLNNKKNVGTILDFLIRVIFKVALSQDLLDFFSWSDPIWVPDKQSKMVLLKNAFSWRYSRKTWLGAVLYCTHWAESTNLFWFSKTSIFRTFRIYVMIFRKIVENISKIQNWLWLPGSKSV